MALSFFVIVGVAACTVVVGFIVVSGISFIDDTIKNYKHKLKIKHRFNKPPTAKCYCIDCEKHRDNGSCSKFNGWHTSETWFCWDATPISKENNIKQKGGEE